MPEPHSDSRAPPAGVSWDFGDPTKWEAALDASPDVAGLASSPLLLFMVLAILPSPISSVAGADGKVASC